MYEAIEPLLGGKDMRGVSLYQTHRVNGSVFIRRLFDAHRHHATIANSGMRRLALCDKTDSMQRHAIQYFLNAAEERTGLLPATHDGAVRLFNGYTEGVPGLTVELYGETLVIWHHGSRTLADELFKAAVERFPFITAALWKQHAHADIVLLGNPGMLCTRILEADIWYAIRLTLHSGTGLYLDTRPLRAWAKANLSGKVVLNAFAYTGALGVAAQAAPAAQVIHTDRSARFLAIAKASYALNGWKISPSQFVIGDFFAVMRKFNRQGKLFDCVFVDPPYFGGTSRQGAWHADDMWRLLNKVRPLVGHGGRLVAVNNGVFVSGTEYMEALERICADGYATMESLIPAPLDFVGTRRTRTGSALVDPKPFNHSTKIAILRMTRKDMRVASPCG